MTNGTSESDIFRGEADIWMMSEIFKVIDYFWSDLRFWRVDFKGSTKFRKTRDVPRKIRENQVSWLTSDSQTLSSKIRQISSHFPQFFTNFPYFQSNFKSIPIFSKPPKIPSPFQSSLHSPRHPQKQSIKTTTQCTFLFLTNIISSSIKNDPNLFLKLNFFLSHSTQTQKLNRMSWESSSN